MDDKILICSFIDPKVADGAAKFLGENNISFDLEKNDDIISLYVKPDDEKSALEIVKAYDKEIVGEPDNKGFLRKFAETALALLIIGVLLAVYVYGVDVIIGFFKNLF